MYVRKREQGQFFSCFVLCVWFVATPQTSSSLAEASLAVQSTKLPCVCLLLTLDTCYGAKDLPLVIELVKQPSLVFRYLA